MATRVIVKVLLKSDVMDPQGLAIMQSLASLGHEDLYKARVGRCFELTLSTNDREVARAEAERMCARLLANPVLEDYEIEIPA